MNKEQIIEELRKIRWVDKFHTFKDLVPEVEKAGDDEQKIVSDIIEDCCTELIRLYNQKKKPTKATIRKTMFKYMDDISYTDVNTECKDLGYEMFWYIAEKIDINLKKYTDTKVYGYWKVEDNTLKMVKKRGKRKA